MGGECCVVPNCFNYRMKTNKQKALGGPHVAYYSFPKEPKHRDIWIRFVGRVAQDQKTNWLPTSCSFICSSHFAGNIRSKLPIDHNFHPTIHPGKPNKRYDPEAALGRSNRLKKRREIAVQKKEEEEKQNHIDINNNLEPEPVPKKREIFTQTEIPLPKVCATNYTSIPHQGKMNMWMCELTSTHAGTQVRHDDFATRSTSNQTVDNYDNSKEQGRKMFSGRCQLTNVAHQFRLNLVPTANQKDLNQPTEKSALHKDYIDGCDMDKVINELEDRSTAIQTIDNYDNSKEQFKQNSTRNQSTYEFNLPSLPTSSKKYPNQPVNKSALHKDYMDKVISESADFNDTEMMELLNCVASIKAKRPVKQILESVGNPNKRATVDVGVQKAKPANSANHDNIKNKLAQ